MFDWSAGRYETTAEMLEPVSDRVVEADFLVGDAQDLPFEDESFDMAVSVFAVIFAPDAGKAVGEALRVVRPGGGVLISHWVPRGTMDEVVGIGMRAVMEAMGTERPARFDWNDDAALHAMAEAHGARLEMVGGELAQRDVPAEAYMQDFSENHPIQIATLPVLEQAGTYDAVREKVLEALHRGNEATDGSFQITAPYRVAIFRKGQPQSWR